ncbi:helix-turn-helix domain-containing protein [Methylobacterium planeticum]|uniref:Helix-turn-helix domain-containing protein n=1 Tax=Methylobacterium planeticum TaxID=2615211 RepID=A0A6N6MJ64_9HYPH|nr:helix-turn-helix domain-containing protein [Methylobacterium planeticum]
MSPKVLTPALVAERWGCSERHVRNMANRGDLASFRLGGKLLRIPLSAVEALEQAECQTSHTRSDASRGSASSLGGRGASGNVTALAPLTRARLDGLRQRSTPNEPARKEIL